MKKSAIEKAIERGEAKRRADAEAKAEADRKATEEQRRATEKLHAEYRKVADQWVGARLLKEVEAATARGERYLDIDNISRDLRCTAKILADAVREAGLSIQESHHEYCDYETGRGEGTYWTSYKAVW